MTGRKGRVVSNDDGSITYESRSELDVPVEILNLTEKQRFMDGEKVIGEFSASWCVVDFLFCLQQMPDSQTEHRHHLRSRQLRYFLASWPSSKEPEEKSPHDARAALERWQSHSAVRSVDTMTAKWSVARRIPPAPVRQPAPAWGLMKDLTPVVYSQGELTGQTRSRLQSTSSWYPSLQESRDSLPLLLKD